MTDDTNKSEGVQDNRLDNLEKQVGKLESAQLELMRSTIVMQSEIKRNTEEIHRVAHQFEEWAQAAIYSENGFLPKSIRHDAEIGDLKDKYVFIKKLLLIFVSIAGTAAAVGGVILKFVI